MGGILNGMALHGGVRPYGGTFLVFSDYMRPSIRLAALMEAAVIYVFTHDSIGVGEDGPTHQPVEHVMALRAIPNLTVIRPADAVETAGAWLAALANRKGPTALILTRQNLPPLGTTISQTLRGGYVLAEATRDGQPVEPDVILSLIHILYYSTPRRVRRTFWSASHLLAGRGGYWVVSGWKNVQRTSEGAMHGEGQLWRGRASRATISYRGGGCHGSQRRPSDRWIPRPATARPTGSSTPICSTSTAR